MKKVQGMAAAVLAAGMLLASPVWAAEKPVPVVQEMGGAGVQMEAPKPVLTAAQKLALEKVYRAVPELKELSVQHVTNEGDRTWSVMLSDWAPGTDRGIQIANAHLTFETATGELISYDFRNPAWASEKVPSPTLAREKAAAFARQILGDKIKDYIQGDDMGFGGGGSAWLELQFSSGQPVRYRTPMSPTTQGVSFGWGMFFASFANAIPLSMGK